MANRLPLTDADGEVRELTKEDLEQFRPAREVLPASLQKKLGMRGAPAVQPRQRINVSLSREVVDTFRATGQGWQTRMDGALKDWLQTHALRD